MYVYTYHGFFSCNIIFKTTLFNGFTTGGPWVPSYTKQNFNRAQKYKVIAFKKNKKTFKDVTRGRPWVSPFMKQNLNRT
jgi:hypothetical protein